MLILCWCLSELIKLIFNCSTKLQWILYLHSTGQNIIGTETINTYAGSSQVLNIPIYLDYDSIFLQTSVAHVQTSVTHEVTEPTMHNFKKTPPEPKKDNKTNIKSNKTKSNKNYVNRITRANTIQSTSEERRLPKRKVLGWRYPAQ